MTPNEFKSLISQLNGSFNGYYNTERAKILWEEMIGLSNDTAKLVINSAIRKHKFAPTISELLLIVAEQREINNKREKDKSRKESDEFWNAQNNPEEVQYRINAIKRRIAGEMSDEEWNEFRQVIDNAANAEEESKEIF